MLPFGFFVKIDPNANIIYQSNQPFFAIDLKNLINQVLIKGKNTGIINFRQSKYFYYQTSLPKRAGKLIIFQDLKPDKIFSKH